MQQPDMTCVSDTLLWGIKSLQDSGNDEPRADAEILLASVLNINRAKLCLEPDSVIRTEEFALYKRSIEKRANGIPAAYLTRRKEFMGLDFIVDNRVLVPRPETELLVEETLKIIANYKEESEIFVADIGTGSGCIAMSLACTSNRNIRIYATDISKDALEVARANATRHGCGGKIEFAEGYLALPLFDCGLSGKMDIIVSNLPYIRSVEIESLMPEVRSEPRIALDGGADGMCAIRRLIPQARTALKPGGWLALEVGFGQAKAVTDIMCKQGFEEVYTRPDLAGIERIVIGKRNV